MKVKLLGFVGQLLEQMTTFTHVGDETKIRGLGQVFPKRLCCHCHWMAHPIDEPVIPFA